MPHDPHLADLMRQALRSWPAIAEKKMFGGVCWMLHGHMLCGVETGRYMFRVGKLHEAEALAQPGATRMDFTGRPMAGFVWVQADAALEDLPAWLERAASYVRSLPLK